MSLHTPSAQHLQPQVHQLNSSNLIRSPIAWVKRFEELAHNFAEQDTTEDIMNWNKYLLQQLDDEDLVKEYNAWS